MSTKMTARILASAGILLAGMFTTGMAQADAASLASLVSASGKVLVDQGKGFVTARPGMTLNDKDRVITLNGSAAAVAFADGCVSKLDSNNLLTIDRQAGCDKAALSTQQPLRYAAAIGDTRTDVPANAGTTPGQTAGGAAGSTLRSATPLILGGVWGGMIVYGNNNNDNRPISNF